jgi:hypothetical protein
LSEVRVRPRIAPLDSCSLPELKEHLDPVIARWGRFEQEIPVCVLEPDDEGEWKGGLWHPQREATVALRYDPKRGLCLDTR